MIRNRRQLYLALATLTASAMVAEAASFSENFDSSPLNANLTVSSTAGFSFSNLNNQLVVAEQAGVGIGNIYVTTRFEILGDFTVIVQGGSSAPGSLAPAALGLMVQLPLDWGNGYADVFFSASGRIYANLRILPVNDQQSAALSATAVTFQIRRTGNTLFLQYDAGTGVQTLSSVTHTNLSVPLNVSLFLINQSGGTNACSGWFDNLALTADQLFTPMPGFVVTCQPAAVLISWPTVANTFYQPEYRPDLTTSTWTPLGLSMLGDGSPMAFTHWVLGQPNGFYRVHRTPARASVFAVTNTPAAILLSWPSVANNHYQVEYRPALTANAWTPLGPPMTGTGSIMSITNVISQPPNTYKVIQMP